MEELVYLKNDEAVCDSLQVAEKKAVKDVGDIIIFAAVEGYDNGFSAFDYWFKDAGSKESLLLLACEFLVRNDFNGYKLLKAYSMESHIHGENTGYLEFLIQSGHLSQFAKRDTKRNGKKRVYVFDMNGNFVKIGVSNDVSERSKQVSNSAGIAVTRIYASDFLNDCFSVENKMHTVFKDKKMSGEFFHVPFDEAVAVLKALTKKEISGL